MSTLNKEQQEAVNYIGSPLCIFAGPGTGKTLVLQKKIAHLISKHTQPENILGLTFTNSAANELKNRVHEDTYINKHLIQIGTFHSQCLKIIQRHPTKCELQEGFDTREHLLTPEKQEERIYKILAELSIPWNQKYLPAIRESLSKAKKKQEWDENNTSYAQRVTKEIYNLYQYQLKNNNEIDIDDMIIKVNLMFTKYPETLKEYQDKFKYILVDESQDMDETQYQFLQHLNCENTTIVGDDDQCIFQFTGSNLKYIEQFIKDFNAKTITLKQNYRSTRRIIETSKELIKHNTDRFDKDIATQNEEGEKLKILISQDEKEEAENILRLAENMSNTAILYRQNKQAEPFEQVFQDHGIPYKIIGSTGYYQRKEIKDAISLVSLTIKNDAASFQRALSIQAGIGPRTIEKIMSHAQATKKTYLNACGEPLEGIREEQHANLKKFQETYYDISDQPLQKQAQKVIEEFMPPLNKLAQERIRKFITNMSKWNNSIQEFLNHITYLDTSPNTIKLLTLHKSKGMEFENVIISGYEQGIIPHHSNVYDSNEVDIQEERRLAYVGITRAAKTIVLSYVHHRRLFDQRQQQTPSQFIKEIPDNSKEYL